MSGELYLHIGMHRTGTSYLQKIFFPALEGINYIQLNNTKDKKLRALFQKDFFTDKNNIFDYVKGKTLFSNEFLWGNPFRKKIDFEERMCFISNNLIDARIIIGLRDLNPKLLRSLYGIYVGEGGILKYNDFVEQCINNKKFQKEYILDILNSFFPNRFFYYEFEEFKANFNDIIKRLSFFLGCNVPNIKNIMINTKKNKVEIRFMRFFNHFFHNEYNPKGILPCQSRFLPQKIFINKVRPR